MKPFKMYSLLLKISLACLLLTACHAQTPKPALTANENENSLLWEISGNGLQSPSYLFGTMHLMCKSDIRFSKQLLAALHNSDAVYFEMDLDDPATMMGGMLLMKMKGGKELKDLFSPSEYERLVIFFRDSLHTPVKLLTTTKPFFLESLLYPKMLPCKSISGIEEELMMKAKEDKKEILGLETIEFQASVFDSIPYEEQAKELLKTIDSLSAYRQYFDTMIQVYKSQEISKIENMFTKSEFGMEEHQDLLLNGRNRNWVSKLKMIFPKQPVFVAVGAGHLVGSSGLISLLRKEGYTLRPLLNK